MKAIKLTFEEILNCSARDYNPSEWAKIINRFSQYENCKFYLIPANDDICSYNRYFASYTNEGINTFKSVSYSSMLSNSGFYVCNILEGFAIEGDELLKIEENEVFIQISEMLGRIKEENTGKVKYSTFVISNSREAIKMMVEKSKLGFIFTKESI